MGNRTPCSFGEGFSLKEGADAVFEVPASYMTPLFMTLEGRMVSLHQNWASKGLPKLKYFVGPKHTVPYRKVYEVLSVSNKCT